MLGPGRRDELLALRTTFGLVVSDDGGQRFRFLCEEAFEYQDGYDPTLAFTSTSALLVGLTDGAMNARELCSPRRQPELQGLSVVDLATDPTGRVVVAALATRDTRPSLRFARSDDGGARFELLPGAMEDAYPYTVDVAPSDPMRLYATATLAGAQAILRSDDGGRTWRRARAMRAEGALYLAGVHPTRPDVLFVRTFVSGLGVDAGASGGALLRSDDGGESLREVARGRGPLRGFAMRDDGARVWVGGPDDGVLRSDDGGQSFAQVSRAGVDCLRWHAGTLWACELLGAGTALLSRSVDGASREVALRLEDVLAPPRCAAGSIVGGFCPDRWVAIRPSVLARARGDAGVVDAGRVDASRDGGEAGEAPGDRCACGVPGARAGGGWWAALAALVALQRTTRRRTTPSPGSTRS